MHRQNGAETQEVALFADPEEEEGTGTPPNRRAHRLWKVLLHSRTRAVRGGRLLWAPVALSGGIGLWFSQAREPGQAAYLGAAALLLLGAVLLPWGWRCGRTVVASGGFVLALIAFGFLLAGARAHQLAAPVLGFRYYGPVEGRVVELDRSSRDRMRVTLDQLVLRDVPPERRPARVRVALARPELAEGLAPGQRVMLTALLSPPAGPAEPGGYDFRRIAWFDQLGAVGFGRTPVLAVAPPDPGDRLLAGHRLRMRLSAAMQAAMPGQPGAVAAALMTGDRSGISEATNAAMRAANLYHIVSISGLHMGMLTGFVFAMLRYGLALAGPLALYWPAKKIAALVALAAASLYLWISGAEVATERAYVMVAVMLLAVLTDRRAVSLRSVALAALAILVVAPESLVAPGFQMSFAATVALIVIYPPVSRWAAALPGLLRPPVLLVLSSLAAGLSTAPIAAAQFHRMAEYGLVANLAAVPVMGVLVMPAGVLAALLAPLGLAAPALWVMAEGTRWMIFVAETVAGWEGAVRVVPVPGREVLPLLALGAIAVILAGGRRLLQGAGALTCLAGFWLWQGAGRPEVLISEAGDLVGVMTPAGRAMSKSGAAFVAESWLDADGDGARAEAAAARAGFSGPKGLRRAEIGGWEVWHLTGKAAPVHLAEVCHPGALVILAARFAPGDGPLAVTAQLPGPTSLRAGGAADRPVPPDIPRAGAPLKAPLRLAAGCLLYDQTTLAKSGAVALYLAEGPALSDAATLRDAPYGAAAWDVAGGGTAARAGELALRESMATHSGMGEAPWAPEPPAGTTDRSEQGASVVAQATGFWSSSTVPPSQGGRFMLHQVTVADLGTRLWSPGGR
jgi:competence protein ComEC